MKKFLVLALIPALIFSCSKKTKTSNEVNVSYKATEDFVQGSEDIPLIAGMNRILEDAIGFDTNAGSIINSSYSTKLDLEKVKLFYLKTLPGMGWKLVKQSENKLNFRREKEKLEILFDKNKKINLVKFFLSSKV